MPITGTRMATTEPPLNADLRADFISPSNAIEDADTHADVNVLDPINTELATQNTPAAYPIRKLTSPRTKAKTPIATTISPKGNNCAKQNSLYFSRVAL